MVRKYLVCTITGFHHKDTLHSMSMHYKNRVNFYLAPPSITARLELLKSLLVLSSFNYHRNVKVLITNAQVMPKATGPRVLPCVTFTFSD